jgi:hypothetical protein
VPAGLLRRLKGEPAEHPADFARETERVERLAVDAVMNAERRLNFVPRDVGELKLGYDVESSAPVEGSKPTFGAKLVRAYGRRLDGGRENGQQHPRGGVYPFRACNWAG